MFRAVVVALLLALLLPLTATAQGFSPPEATPVTGDDPLPDNLFPVVFEIEAEERPRTHANDVMRALDIPREQFTERIRYIYEHAITGYALLLSPYEAERAERLFGGANELGVTQVVSEQVTFSVPEKITTFEVQGKTSDALRGTEVIPAGVLRTGAPLDDAVNVDVAVIDTGVDRDNPELNVVGGYDCTSETPEEYGIDGHGHGTHVAGTIAAKADGRGVVGVAPGARVHSVRVLDSSGSGSYASVICGIDYVAGQADVIEVANMSLGGPVTGELTTDPMYHAVQTATDLGVTIVVAAGNSTQDARGFAPASYPEVITVSAYTDYDGMPGGFALAPNAGCTAMSVDDELAAFSNYGEDVDLAAPGVCVLSTYLNKEYAYASGTSMASPHVAGCVAVFLEANPDQRANVEDQLLEWSQSRSDVGIGGDHDDQAEPVLNCSAVPRYSGT